ncbi:MAG: sarcosine oxidase subunit beta [Paracoccaceae bacterium]|jgi:sarcosine oxidase subunit beta
MSQPDILVVGAGITGASAALELARSGQKVEVIERYGPAAMASGWTLAGVRQSGRDPAELAMSRLAVALWSELDRVLEAETGYRQHGNLRLARSAQEFETIRDLVTEQSAAGLDMQFLPDLAATRDVVPALSEQVVAASWCASDGSADPIATVSAYLGMAQKLGATSSIGEEVQELIVTKGRITQVVTNLRILSPGSVILASGVLINRLLDPMGLALPLRRPVVTVLRTMPAPKILGPVLGVANADMAARQENSGRFRISSGAEDSGTLAELDGKPLVRPTMRGVMGTIRRVAKVLPALAGAEVEAIWGGMLDMTPDALPVIDKVPGVHNLVVAAGFSGHGFGIGPVTGPLAADLALDRSLRLDVQAFRFDRFAGRTQADALLTLHG